jgi:hypothetical protein
VPVNTELVPLSPDEVQTLAHYEQIIERGIKTFVEVGHALLVIRDQQLYRQDYATFEDYLRQRWDLSRPYAYQLMDASVVVEHLSAGADIVAMHGMATTDTILPANEAQARPLTSLSPEQQQEVWKEAVETAPPSGITAKHVQTTVKRVKERASEPKVSTPKAQESKPPTILPKAVQEAEWLRRFDQRCVCIHEFFGELTRAGGVEVFVRGWEAEHQVEFIKRATFWAKRLDEFRQHLEKTIIGAVGIPISEVPPTEPPAMSHTTEA